MFPKLYEGSPWLAMVQAVAAAACCLSAVAVVYWGIAYVQQPGERPLGRLIVALVLLAILGMGLLALGLVERSRVRRFDPNTGDPHPRIEMGRSRAMTRREFEATHGREASGEAG
jgi:hypothetical protein